MTTPTPGTTGTPVVPPSRDSNTDAPERPLTPIQEETKTAVSQILVNDAEKPTPKPLTAVDAKKFIKNLSWKDATEEKLMGPSTEFKSFIFKDGTRVITIKNSKLFMRGDSFIKQEGEEITVLK